MKNNITVIIPLSTISGKKDNDMLKRAMTSAEGQCKSIVIVGAPIEKKKQDTIKSWVKTDVTFINNEDPTYANNVNVAVKECNTEYFSVLEYDDAFSEKWVENVEKYKDFDGVDKFAFLPLTELTNDADGETIGYANEAFWATSFSEEIGYLDLEAMQDYLGFNTSGGIFKTKEFLALGGLKASMKLVFWYEFLMRALYKEKKIFVVPKVGYFHNANRKGGIMDEYSQTLSEKETDFWLDLAKKEYFFPQDRKKVYEEEE